MTTSMTPPASDAKWPPRRACAANECQSGRKVCPCPSACELPEDSAAGQLMDKLDRVPVRHVAIAFATLLAALIAGLHLIFRFN